ncbi:hypothetical protein BKA83DRAFT_4121133 [Pisolithus microcarpus]|nr:hypothetical protein BKA83DRAFT_4121133 [Pisolithus microcarpus]
MPPASAQGIAHGTEQNTQHYLNPPQAHKQANLEATQPTVHKPKHQQSTEIHVQPIHNCLLDWIPEDDDDELAPAPSSAMLQCTAEFIITLSNHGPGMESEVSDSGGEEVMDINNCNSSDLLSSESEDGTNIQEVLSDKWQPHTAINPVQCPGKSKKDTTSKGRVVAKSMSLNYDPET